MAIGLLPSKLEKRSDSFQATECVSRVVDRQFIFQIFGHGSPRPKDLLEKDFSEAWMTSEWDELTFARNNIRSFDPE